VSTRLVRGHWLLRAGELIGTMQQSGVGHDVLGGLQELIEHLATFTPNAWYPRHLLMQMLDGIAAAARDEATARESLLRCGRSIVVRDDDVFLASALSLMHPSLFASSLPKLWALEQQGEVSISVDEVGDKRAVVRLVNAGEYRHIAIVAAGWITSMMVSVGVPEPRVTQTGWTLVAPAPAEARFEIEWS
jgi:hypothetical protein